MIFAKRFECIFSCHIDHIKTNKKTSIMVHGSSTEIIFFPVYSKIDIMYYLVYLNNKYILPLLSIIIYYIPSKYITILMGIILHKNVNLMNFLFKLFQADIHINMYTFFSAKKSTHTSKFPSHKLCKIWHIKSRIICN